MTSLTGKVALVTGASAGIGAAIAEKLVREGVTVVGCARNIGGIEELTTKLTGCQGRLYAIKCDLAVEEDIFAMFEEIKNKYGGLDICVNNAGMGKPASVIDGKTEDWKAMTNLNVISLSICTREALKLFELKKADGHIINLGSVAGHVLSPGAGGHWYAATKWMVRTLTECLRLELREKGARTRVTHISPGLVETEFAIRGWGEELGSQLYRESEVLTAEQISDAVYFSLSAAPNMQVSDVIIRPTSQKD